MSNPFSTLPQLIDAYPEHWTFDKYTAKHKSGVELWIGTGFLFLGFWRRGRIPIPIPLWTRWKVWKALKRAQQYNALNKIDPIKEPSEADPYEIQSGIVCARDEEIVLGDIHKNT